MTSYFSEGNSPPVVVVVVVVVVVLDKVIHLTCQVIVWEEKNLKVLEISI